MPAPAGRGEPRRPGSGRVVEASSSLLVPRCRPRVGRGRTPPRRMCRRRPWELRLAARRRRPLVLPRRRAVRRRGSGTEHEPNHVRDSSSLRGRSTGASLASRPRLRPARSLREAAVRDLRRPRRRRAADRRATRHPPSRNGSPLRRAPAAARSRRRFRRWARPPGIARAAPRRECPFLRCRDGRTGRVGLRRSDVRSRRSHEVVNGNRRSGPPAGSSSIRSRKAETTSTSTWPARDTFRIRLPARVKRSFPSVDIRSLASGCSLPRRSRISASRPRTRVESRRARAARRGSGRRRISALDRRARTAARRSVYPLPSASPGRGTELGPWTVVAGPDARPRRRRRSAPSSDPRRHGCRIPLSRRARDGP